MNQDVFSHSPAAPSRPTWSASLPWPRPRPAYVGPPLLKTRCLSCSPLPRGIQWESSAAGSDLFLIAAGNQRREYQEQQTVFLAVPEENISARVETRKLRLEVKQLAGSPCFPQHVATIPNQGPDVNDCAWKNPGTRAKANVFPTQGAPSRQPCSPGLEHLSPHKGKGKKLLNRVFLPPDRVSLKMSHSLSSPTFPPPSLPRSSTQSLNLGGTAAQPAAQASLQGVGPQVPQPGLEPWRSASFIHSPEVLLWQLPCLRDCAGRTGVRTTIPTLIGLELSGGEEY
ncbi:uncharacterized protein LOC118913565 isoform X2 [Manis pentadactyla]|uniref:uncharacterized protein LOC118913565 isoform X2 n=1 Tax=Manis pentadactyla TaxID=143292 RepID=UPI00255C2CCB|nr:uncharacterized protein LOC118913565 isoform X2 [Manis pentadactyla]